jgi:glycosyltransferase involved in cell wall biosynthesis
MPVSFTVAIPTHNRRETVLMSIESALEQSRPPIEVIVVADGCTDGTQKAIEDLADQRAIVLDVPKGPAYGYSNRNEALRAARGDVISWLGDDDLYLPDHLLRVGEIFDHLEVDMVQALTCIVHEDDRLEPLGMDWRVPRYRELMLAGRNRTPLSGVSHRADPAASAGGWSDDVPEGGDMKLWQGMLQAGARTDMVEETTVLHFRAAGRSQPYQDRVAQNRRYLETIRDPAGLARLRSRIAEARWGAAAAIEQRADDAAAAVRLRERLMPVLRIWWWARGRLASLRARR